MKIIGHRGARGEAPENSLESIRLALEAGVDMIELDLRMSGDLIVLSHDTIKHHLTYTSLSEALNSVNGKVPLNLEIKEFQVTEFLPELLDGYKGMVLLSSFNYKTLSYCHNRHPDIPVAILESWSGVRATHRAKKLHTKRIHMNQRWLWRGFISSMSHRGWQLYAYTVNTTHQADVFQKAGLAGIFTDYPTDFVQYRNNKRKAPQL